MNSIRGILKELYEEVLEDEMYKNPSWEEVLKLKSDYDRLKFAANHRNKNLYIASYDTDHYYMLKYMDISGRGNDILFGTGKIRGRSIEIKGSPSNIKVEDYIINGDYDWLENYNFEIKDYRESLIKYRESIKEEFVVGFEGRNGYMEIFKNPDRKEILSVARSGEGFRYIADKRSKNLYIASQDVLHQEMQEEIGNMKDHYFDLFSGIAQNKGNYVDVKYGDLNCNIEDQIVEGEYDWVKKYGFRMRDLKIEILEKQKIPKEEWKYVLDEEWALKTDWVYGSADVFKNPSKKDLAELYQNIESKGPRGAVIRFLIDYRGKSVYIWDSMKAVHGQVARTLNVGEFEYIKGQGYIKKGKIIIRDDWIYGRVVEMYEDGELDWMEKYNFDVKGIKREIAGEGSDGWTEKKYNFRVKDTYFE